MSTTFNTLNDVKKKQRFLLLLDSGLNSNVIAYATSANLSFSADDVDVSNKMDGSWSTTEQGKKNAEISVDGLVAYGTEYANEDALETLWNEDKVYKFLYATFDVIETDDGIGTQLEVDASEPYYMGNMKVSSLELTSDNNDVCKYSCSGNSIGNVKECSGYYAWYPIALFTEEGVFTLHYYQLKNAALAGDALFSFVDVSSYNISITTTDGDVASQGGNGWSFDNDAQGKMMHIEVSNTAGDIVCEDYIKIPYYSA